MCPEKVVRRAAIALVLLGVAQGLAAQVSFVTLPSPAEQAAGRRKLRRVEARFVPELRRRHGDPAVGARLGDALRDIPNVSLDHPSPALSAQVKAARDPYALALAIVDDVQHYGDPTTYEIDVLLTALARTASAERRATLWAKAAVIERRDLALRLAFLERADDSLSGLPPGATSDGCKLDTDLHEGKAVAPNACGIASRRLEEMLDAGLSREALAMFDALPEALRERLLATWAEPDSAHADQRLSLVAARLLEGDKEGARKLLARIQTAPWQAGQGGATGADRPDPSAVWRAVLERWLNAPAADDAFPLLAKFVAVDLFGLSRQVAGVGMASYASLADRERYPEIARVAWRQAAFDTEVGEDTEARVPPEVALAAKRLRTALTARSRHDTDASQAAARAASGTPQPHVKCQVDCDRLDLDPNVKILAIDHSGRTGIAILENYPFFGDLFQIEMRDGELFAVRIEEWIS
jgi:hypothetical protein